MKTKNTKSVSIGIFPIWLVLILLKAFGYASIGWVWVLTFPIWLTAIVWGSVALSVLIFTMFALWLDSK